MAYIGVWSALTMQYFWIDLAEITTTLTLENEIGLDRMRW
jgi:hypothetical protein